MLLGIRTSQIIFNNHFGTRVLLVKNSAGGYKDGLYQNGTETIQEITASYQPASIDERQNLPEGERLREVIAIWVQTQDKNLLRPMKQGIPNSPGDIIRINISLDYYFGFDSSGGTGFDQANFADTSIDYEVYSVDNYSLNRHIKALCMRIENQSD